MNTKTKKWLAIVALFALHLLATAFCSLSLYAQAIADVYGQSAPNNSAMSLVRIASALLEFPLVHLARLVPYEPGAPSSSAVAALYLFSYVANSALWATLIYYGGQFVSQRKRQRAV